MTPNLHLKIIGILLMLNVCLISPIQANNFIASISKYDTKDGLSTKEVIWICQDNRGILWLGTQKGIDRFDGEKFELVVEYDFDQEDKIEVLPINQNQLLIRFVNAERTPLTFNTINFELNNSKDQFTKKENAENSPELLWQIKQGNLQVFHSDQELILDLLAEYPSLSPLSINDHLIGNNSTWLATDKGLIKINVRKNYFQRHLYQPQKNLNLSNSKESERFFYRGLFAMNINSSAAGNLLVTTRARGVIELGNNETRIPGSQGYFWGSFTDKDHNIWISRFDDILKYDLKTNTQTVFNFPKFGDKAWAFYQDNKDRIWIACNRAIYYVEKNGDQLIAFDHGFDEENIIPLKQKYFFYEDRNGTMWMGGTAGLYTIDFEKGITKHYWPGGTGEEHLPILDMRHMYEDEEGIFWLATTNGLYRWNRETHEYRRFGLENGLSSQVLFGVYGDEYGYLWISSAFGLMQFSRKTFAVKAYQTSDGINHNIFNRISHHQAKDGRLYFGGYNGVTSFHPKDFKNAFSESINVSLSLQSANTLQSKDQASQDKFEEFNVDNRITIHPGEGHLDLNFQLLNFETGIRKMFEYKIDEGGESYVGDWKKMTGNHLQLARLPYGTHLLKVRGTTAFSHASKEILEIPITVLKPFYLQLWFYLLACFMIVAALFYVQYKKSKKILQRQKELESLVKKRTHKIQSQANQLMEMDKVKSRFLENISHEFRTPLTLILNILHKENVQSFNAKEISEGRIFGKTEVDILQRNSGRLKLLIEQLLDLSKLEAGKMDLNAEKGRPHQLVKGITDTFQTLAKSSEIDLQFKSDIQSLELYFDRDKMEKIFYNLLSNALKFTPKYGTVSVDLKNSETELVVTVQDSGIGIPATEINKVFDRFYQVKQVDNYGYEGSGLGLALVKDFVELHNGIVAIKSEYGKGTCFTLRFPLDSSYLGDEQKIITSTGIETSSAVSAAPILTEPLALNDTEVIDEALPLLLIVEDNLDLQFYHHKLLSKKYNLAFATDGKLGIQKAKALIPDLILTDVMMPKLDGIELCKTLKNDELCNHIPIVLLTAKASKSDRLKGISAGADDFLVKPFDQKELDLRMANLLKQRELLKAKYASLELKPKDYPEAFKDPFIDKLIEVIDLNIADVSFGIQELSDAVSLSRSQLFRKVKAIVGETPTDFLKKYRLKKAYQLLLDDAGNASEVSFSVGFRTPNYFHKCFKEEYGFTPGELLRSAHNS